jgi:hypothetical protein
MPELIGMLVGILIAAASILAMGKYWHGHAPLSFFICAGLAAWVFMTFMTWSLLDMYVFRFVERNPKYGFLVDKYRLTYDRFEDPDRVEISDRWKWVLFTILLIGLWIPVLASILFHGLWTVGKWTAKMARKVYIKRVGAPLLAFLQKTREDLKEIKKDLDSLKGK